MNFQPSELNILKIPSQLLRKKADLVNLNNISESNEIAQSMLYTMYSAKGIGLAAPQVGISDQIVVIDIKPNGKKTPLVMFNPQIISKSVNMNESTEGCLSIPHIQAKVTRPSCVEVRFFNEKGQEETLYAEGLLSTCVQHEIDHLNGILYLDYLSPLKRNMVLKKYKKNLQNY